VSSRGSFRCSFQGMASRQERRKAERDAAKRAPAPAGTAGVAGAAGAAAALANINVKPLGDWKTQTENHKLGLTSSPGGRPRAPTSRPPPG